MCTNFRETLEEQLKNPEFAASWEALASTRELRWQALFAEGLQQAFDSGFDGLKAQVCAEDYADGHIDAREFFTFNMLELRYNFEEIADVVELPLEWVQALAKVDRSKILNVLSLNEFLDDPESYIDAIKNSVRPTLIRDSGENEVVALGWEQYQKLLAETNVLHVSEAALKYAEEQIKDVFRKKAPSLSNEQLDAMAKETILFIDWDNEALMHKGYVWIANDAWERKYKELIG